MGGGAVLIAAGIAIMATVLLPGMPVFMAAIGWAIAGLGMGLAYSTAALVTLETSPPGEEGFSSSALQLMFTLGTALGAGVGGAVVAIADAGTIDLAPALAIVYGIAVAGALLTALVAQRVPARGPARPRAEAPSPRSRCRGTEACRRRASVSPRGRQRPRTS